jgi:GNAT superfamily N-acetyltransferase
MTLAIRPLALDDVDAVAAAIGKRVEKLREYVAEEAAGAIATFTAWSDGVFVGYVILRWRSAWFGDGVPEIQDFNVVRARRRQGIGTALLDAAEARAAERSAVVGLGVGMTADYGAAQIMYVKRGYVPDGRGLATHGRPVRYYGESVFVDDDLVLYFTRTLR